MLCVTLCGNCGAGLSISLAKRRAASASSDAADHVGGCKSSCQLSDKRKKITAKRGLTRRSPRQNLTTRDLLYDKRQTNKEGGDHHNAINCQMLQTRDNHTNAGHAKTVLAQNTPICFHSSTAFVCESARACFLCIFDHAADSRKSVRSFMDGSLGRYV